MELKQEQQVWNSMGDLDPFWAILVDPDKKFGGWDPEEFFGTGEREIERVLAAVGELGHPVERERALDFGCGVGRLTRALSQHFGEVEGVDISVEMVQKARALNRDRPNCAFHANARDDLTLFPSERFDLVYSVMVLQHVPSATVIARYVREFVRVLRPGGMLVFQLPSRIPLRKRLQPRRRLYGVLRALGVSDRFLYQRAGLIPFRMLHLPRARVAELVEAEGGQVVRTEFTDHAGPEIESSMYYVTKPRRVG